MNWPDFKVGEEIEVVDQKVSQFPIRGTVLETDIGVRESYAKIRVESPALPAPEIWVCLRLARPAH